ncbi:MAG: tol-pal system protein YbgF [candidate division KSB1 bacterium]|nr:tol-pal system protein YbgF [candidate division KSB1 bacterium]MDZ7275275.1 tol-pal system protein YbgF [candidate division KSB1 bacterium]MDZ7287443.1 tol-pal system protein YbgF [candidate division KSB1 bacterium]MDZ7299557.1 tol-pal system protein YbgF [candidate division KSB1 bacterium]MDZ7308015.1 tol-pal system protein YbgF [candidate division KSB1 bacterium]
MRNLMLSLLAGTALAFNACLTPSQMRRVETDNAALRAQVDSLRLQVQRLRTMTARAEMTGGKADESLLRLRADNELRLNQFAEQLRILSDRVDDLDNRMANLPGKLRLMSEKTSATASSPAAAATTTPAAAMTAEHTDEAQKLYDTAYQDLVRGQIDLAREGFLEFLRKYPHSTLADNAQYWIGESFYTQKNYARAATEFAVVPDKYPGSDKLAAAMLKRAYSLMGLNRTPEARVLLEQVIKKFPRSAEAELARAKLQE